ncbi:sensor histidine kinase [Pseudoponticoccus marisrubri]|uniref:histidine kinase n=1 Tax=Pseudoponticoccus marisrubri TaxID=1685382 RepID=A0A0W7WNQ5_9RHOB|nr:ATP-binding protein [Pseudoponticoccus marisrubri]KUF12222.1 hypothetical protein AVJ23_00350 [Pseudoponticoccus marisrubri]
MDARISVEADRAGPRCDLAFHALPRPALIVSRAGLVLGCNAALRQRIDPPARPDPGAPCLLEALFRGRSDRLLDDIKAAATGNRLTLTPRHPCEGAKRLQSFEVCPLRDGTVIAPQFLLVEAPGSTLDTVFTSLNLRLREANERAARARELNRRLKEKHAELERFSHAAAHDLKAPLRSIANCLSFLEEDLGHDLPEDSREDLAIASRAAGRLERLISDLLQLARTDTVELAREPVAVADAMAEVQELLAAQVTETGATIRIEGDPGMVEAEPVLFRQLLQNLVSNALKYRAPDRAPEILLRRVPGAPDRLQLQDNGTGFENERKERIFAPFQRLVPHGQIEGSGLGLATCQAICRRHGWQMDATGDPGRGAMFEIIGV